MIVERCCSSLQSLRTDSGRAMVRKRQLIKKRNVDKEEDVRKSESDEEANTLSKEAGNTGTEESAKDAMSESKRKAGELVVGKPKDYGSGATSEDKEEAKKSAEKIHMKLRDVKTDFGKYYQPESGEEPQKKADSKVYPRVTDNITRDEDYKCMENEYDFSMMPEAQQVLVKLKALEPVKGEQ